MAGKQNARHASLSILLIAAVVLSGDEHGLERIQIPKDKNTTELAISQYSPSLQQQSHALIPIIQTTKI